MRWVHAVVSLALLSVFAGCIGNGADDLSAATDPNAQADDAKRAAGNVTGNVTGGVSEETYSGSVVAVNAVVVVINPQGDTAADWEVKSGAQKMTITAEITGGDAQVNIAPPGCAGDATSMCEEAFTTSGGSGKIDFKKPESGAWGSRVFNANPGPANLEWKLTVTIVYGEATTQA